MAADTVTVNGMYDTQYTQPAELAATTPSHQASASQSSTNTTQKPDTQEIGWYFVEQYYTTLSKTPDRVHLFYNKKSQLITGREAEKVLTSFGSKNINEKIKSLDFQDTKVRVLNVDCQSSFENIVVQVIGELSNKSQPHRRFVQTFVLATQSNGYFVLNDIFRYLNDEDDEIVEDEPQEQEQQQAQEEPVVDEEVPVQAEVVSEPAVHEEEERTVNSEAAAEQLDEKLEEAAKDEPAPTESKVNGVAEESPIAAVAAAPSVETSTADIVEAEDAPAAATATATDEAIQPAAEAPVDPEPTPAQTPPKSTSVQETAPVKKTWASLVGSTKPTLPIVPQTSTSSSSTAASTQPAQTKSQKSVPQTQSIKTPSEPAAIDASASTASPSSQNGWQEAGKKARGQQPKAQAGIVHAYIKNVKDKIDARELREKMESFGNLQYFDVNRQKQCAFIEFADPAGYSAAIAANPLTVTGEQLNVEERRPRPGQPGAFNSNYGRGGAAAGRGRASAPREGGRGGFQGRGGKPSTAPARGRGQSQTS